MPKLVVRALAVTGLVLWSIYGPAVSHPVAQAADSVSYDRTAGSRIPRGSIDDSDEDDASDDLESASADPATTASTKKFFSIPDFRFSDVDSGIDSTGSATIQANSRTISPQRNPNDIRRVSGEVYEPTDMPPRGVIEDGSPDINFGERPGGSGEYLTGIYSDSTAFLTGDREFAWFLGVKGRAYYQDDQRIEFTGCEQTFGVNGVVDGALRHSEDEWDFSVDSQFFFNQPYDRNIYNNTAYLPSFTANLQINPFEISLLTFSARKNNLLFQAGKMVTPFGRFYFPNYSNSFWDSPFIRSDAILFRETGLLAQWDPEPFIVTAAFTNGGLEMDTNSSKALIARVGLYGNNFSLGSSIKLQDGIGSESQKQCNSHLGVDGMYRWGIWTVSTEAIIDYYGMNRAGLDPNSITWGRSIYFRDANQFASGPLVGHGYYVNVERRGEKWQTILNYGDYYPQKIGDPRQDTPIHRGLIKGTRHLSRYLDAYCVTLIENSVFLFPPEHYRRGFAILAGFEYKL